MALTHGAQSTITHPETGPRGGALDVAWPCTPVAHLAFETDTHFTTIHCS
jgi:hypothetical protein